MQHHARTRTRTSGSIALALGTAITILAACGGSGDSTSPGGNHQDTWSAVSQRTWSLSASNEGYSCHTELIADDQYFTGFRLASSSSAQGEVYLIITNSAANTGDFDCTAASFTGGEMVYAATYGTDAIEFTDGKGVHVPAGHYLTLIVHENNTSVSPVTATTTIEGRVGTSSSVTTPIDIFFAGPGDFQIPSGMHTTQGYCISSGEHILAILPLMRHLGTHQKVEMTTDTTVTTVLDENVDPTNLDYSPLSPELSWPNGARLTTFCTFNNNTGANVYFGEAASNETCSAAIYRYPAVTPSSDEPYECGQFGASIVHVRSEHRQSIYHVRRSRRESLRQTR